jgi:hypothetical protein
MYLKAIMPSLHFKSRDGVSDLPMLIGMINLIHPGRFKIDNDGRMTGLKLHDAFALYNELARNDADPIMEDVVEILKAIGVKDIPIFSSRLLNFDIFKEEVLPLFVSRLEQDLDWRSTGSAADIFKPIKPRQYSIAKMRNRDTNEIQLIVKHLVYTKKIISGLQESESSWQSQKRQVMLAAKCESKI